MTTGTGAIRDTGSVGLLEAVVARVPGGRGALYTTLGALLLADLAILWSVETVLVSTVEGGVSFKYLLMFAVGGGVASVELRRLLARVSLATNTLISAMVRRLLEAIDQFDLRTFELLGADALHRRVTLEAPQVAQAGVPMAATIRYGARAAAAALYLILIAPQIAAVVVVLLALVGALRYAGGATAEAGMASAMGLRDRLHGSMTALVRGVAQVLLHRGRGDALLARIQDQATALAEQNKATQEASLKTEALASVLLYGLITLTGVGLGAVDQDLAARVLIVVMFVLRAVNQLVGHVSTLQRAGVAYGGLCALEARVLDAARARPAVQEIPPITGFQSIALNQVEFAYGDTNEGYVFGPVDLTVSRGEVLFITGPNGSGKSTCLKLLLGLYMPLSGTLEIDGRPVAAPAPQAWRDLFSVVLSEFVLFERLLGIDEVPAERAAELLAWLELTDKVKIEAGRFSTVALSTGQRKRLAMVVALLQDRDVFVFDEWAADQDPEFRDAYYSRIVPDLKRRGKTVICVTHDDQFFHLADRRIVIHAGRVVP